MYAAPDRQMNVGLGPKDLLILRFVEADAQAASQPRLGSERSRKSAKNIHPGQTGAFQTTVKPNVCGSSWCRMTSFQSRSERLCSRPRLAL